MSDYGINAINTLIENAVSSLEYSSTMTGTIVGVDQAQNGIYNVKIENMTYKAYSSIKDLQLDDKVLIVDSNNQISPLKIIICKTEEEQEINNTDSNVIFFNNDSSGKIDVEYYYKSPTPENANLNNLIENFFKIESIIKFFKNPIEQDRYNYINLLNIKYNIINSSIRNKNLLEIKKFLNKLIQPEMNSIFTIQKTINLFDIFNSKNILALKIDCRYIANLSFLKNFSVYPDFYLTIQFTGTNNKIKIPLLQYTTGNIFDNNMIPIVLSKTLYLSGDIQNYFADGEPKNFIPITLYFEMDINDDIKDQFIDELCNWINKSTINNYKYDILRSINLPFYSFFPIQFDIKNGIIGNISNLILYNKLENNSILEYIKLSYHILNKQNIQEQNEFNILFYQPDIADNKLLNKQNNLIEKNLKFYISFDDEQFQEFSLITIMVSQIEQNFSSYSFCFTSEAIEILKQHEKYSFYIEYIIKDENGKEKEIYKSNVVTYMTQEEADNINAQFYGYQIKPSSIINNIYTGYNSIEPKIYKEKKHIGTINLYYCNEILNKNIKEIKWKVDENQSQIWLFDLNDQSKYGSEIQNQSAVGFQFFDRYMFDKTAIYCELTLPNNQILKMRTFIYTDYYINKKSYNNLVPLCRLTEKGKYPFLKVYWDSDNPNTIDKRKTGSDSLNFQMQLFDINSNKTFQLTENNKYFHTQHLSPKEGYDYYENVGDEDAISNTSSISSYLYDFYQKEDGNFQGQIEGTILKIYRSGRSLKNNPSFLGPITSSVDKYIKIKNSVETETETETETGNFIIKNSVNTNFEANLKASINIKDDQSNDENQSNDEIYTTLYDNFHSYTGKHFIIEYDLNYSWHYNVGSELKQSVDMYPLNYNYFLTKDTAKSGNKTYYKKGLGDLYEACKENEINNDTDFSQLYEREKIKEYCDSNGTLINNIENEYAYCTKGEDFYQLTEDEEYNVNKIYYDFIPIASNNVSFTLASNNFYYTKLYYLENNIFKHPNGSTPNYQTLQYYQYQDLIDQEYFEQGHYYAEQRVIYNRVNQDYDNDITYYLPEPVEREKLYLIKNDANKMNEYLNNYYVRIGDCYIKSNAQTDSPNIQYFKMIPKNDNDNNADNNVNQNNIAFVYENKEYGQPPEAFNVSQPLYIFIVDGRRPQLFFDPNMLLFKDTTKNNIAYKSDINFSKIIESYGGLYKFFGNNWYSKNNPPSLEFGYISSYLDVDADNYSSDLFTNLSSNNLLSNMAQQKNNLQTNRLLKAASSDESQIVTYYDIENKEELINSGSSLLAGASSVPLLFLNNSLNGFSDYLQYMTYLVDIKEKQLEASLFIPRLSRVEPKLSEGKDIKASPFWVRSPFQGDYFIPNCTCYAWGRYAEVAAHGKLDSASLEKGLSKARGLCTGNATNWYIGSSSSLTKRTAQQFNNDPDKMKYRGAVMVWGGGSTGAGHVAVVEKIVIENNNIGILVSESGYHHYDFKATVWLYQSNGYNYGSMPFKGFILQ